VSAAQHLGVVLEPDVRIAGPDDATLVRLASALADWRADELRAEVEAQGEAVAPDPEILTDFQEDYVAARDGVLRSMTPQERARAAGSLGMSPATRAPPP
jgi:hypothetical protein